MSVHREYKNVGPEDAHTIQHTLMENVGAEEIVLTLGGKGWAITEMENIDTGLPEDSPYTRITLSK